MAVGRAVAAARVRVRRRVSPVVSRVMRPVGAAMDALGVVGSVVWRSLFGTAAAFCVAGGLLVALGRPDESYAVMLIAGALGAVATFFALLALRVEPDTDPFET